MLVTVGTMAEITVTVVVTGEAEHVPIEPVIVYTVVLKGLAVTTDDVVVLNPVGGLQLYVVTPLAVNTAGLPVHMVAELTFIEGFETTVMVDVAVDVQVPVPPVTV